MMLKMNPFHLTPAFKDYIWGGNRLVTEYHLPSHLTPTAEAWVLSSHKDGSSVVKEGTAAGKSLQMLYREQPDLFGSHCSAFKEFPVLIKLIDAKQNLSIQVHPNDEYALAHEGEYGKTEMWYVVDAEPGAFLYYGFSHSISKEEFRRRIADNTLLEVLNRVEVRPGDCLFIEAGTLHAIGAGLLIAEIQQSSNTTYRVYDYGRLGADGKPRALHIEQAADVTALAPPSRPVTHASSATVRELGSCGYFRSRLVRLEGTYSETVGDDSFLSMLVLQGDGALRWPDGELSFTKGDSLFIPAGTGDITVNGRAQLIFTTV